MDSLSAQEKRFKMMTEDPVGPLILKVAVPTIVSMLVTSVYNMADTYFVSQISTSASGAVGVCFSIMALIQAVGFMLGIGAGSNISRLLGQKEGKKAEQVAATAVSFAAVFGLLFLTFGLLFADDFVRLLGATETIAPYARDYASYILIGAPYMAASFVLNNILRSQGNALYSMIGIGAGGILNILLDPLFIFALNMGTGGAALATIISQFVSFVLLLSFVNGKKSLVHIRLRRATLSPRVWGPIVKTGLPSFYRQGLSALTTVLMNLFAAPYGDAAIAAMSIVSRIFQFVFSVTIGFGQGYQPVCGYNYGAKKFDRVRKAFWFSVRFATMMFTVFAIVAFVFAPQILSVFRKDDAAVIEIGTLSLRLLCCIMPFLSWTMICNMTSQSTGKNFYASLISLCQQGIFFVPLILILPQFWGLLGIQLSLPLSNFLTFLLAIPIGLRLLREFKDPPPNAEDHSALLKS